MFEHVRAFSLTIHTWLYTYLNWDIIKLAPIQTYAPSRDAGSSHFLCGVEDSETEEEECGRCVVPKKVDFTSLHKQNTPFFPSAVGKSDSRKADVLGNDFQNVSFSASKSQMEKGSKL